MTQKEKNAMAREVSEWYDHRENPEHEPIAATPHSDYLPHTQRIGKSVTVQTRRESYRAAQEDAAARRRVILEILSTHREGMTAREVAGELHRRGITPSAERNYAAPRLTELAEAGKVHVIGKKPCPHTGRNVAVWAAGKE